MSAAETVASGLLFPEGPVALADGSVLVVELGTGRLNRIGSNGQIAVVAELGAGPNGAAVGPDGKIYICNNGGSYRCTMTDGQLVLTADPSRYEGGSIQTVDLDDGRVSTLYRACDGVPLQGPNDLVFDADGGFWFTDFGRPTDNGWIYGGIYYARPDGRDIRRVRAGLLSPNGIGLSPGGRRLYWADSYTGRLWQCAIEAPGRLSDADAPLPGRVVETLPGYQLLDSLAVEAGGKVCVATIVNGGITVFDPRGTSEHVPLDDAQITNICFGGADMRMAWITAAMTGRLLRMEWPRPGLTLHFQL